MTGSITSRLAQRLAPWALVALATASGGAHALDRAAFVQLSASVLKIEALRDQGGYSLGSGVTVAPGKVVTNCHVTRDAIQVWVIKFGLRWPARAQAADGHHDLCVLEVPGVQEDVVTLGPATRLHTGQHVVAIGYTGGIQIQSSDGDIVGLHALDGASVIQSTNWFSSGASGGGLFDEDLHLIGILTFRMRSGEAHYYAAPVEWLQAQLASSREFTPVLPVAPGVDVPYWQEPPDKQPTFLRAASMAQDRRWDDLEVLTRQWSIDGPTDPQPWFMRGLAFENLGKLDEARAAFEQAVAVSDGFAPGWYRLGVVYTRLGLIDSARKALAALGPLNADMADELSKLIPKA